MPTAGESGAGTLTARAGPQCGTAAALMRVSNDLGVVAVEGGRWEIYVGGAAGCGRR
jgi:hypothetical protein